MAFFKVKKNKFILIFAAVIGLLVFLRATGLLGPIESSFFSAIKPLSSSLYEWGVGLDSSFVEQQDKEELAVEIENLRREIAILTISQAKCAEIANENNKLRAKLDFSSSHDFKIVLANIVAKEGLFSSSEGDSRDIIINKGSRDDLRPGLAVLSEEGAVIGKISEVKFATARVCLTTSPGCQLAAALQNVDKTQGITDGRLGLTIEMSYIPQLEKIAEGDVVVTSGLSESVPRGLVIGRVISYINESNEVWQTATIEPLINFNNLTIVSVIIP